MMAAIMYDGKKTNMSGLCSMIVGILSWLWFDFNPLSIEALGGNVDPDARVSAYFFRSVPHWQPVR